MGVVYLGLFWYCMLNMHTVFCWHMVLVMVLSTKRGIYYVGLRGHASARIYRSTCRLIARALFSFH